MDNKLSELSKPVAWKIHNDDHYFLEMREEEAETHGRMGKKGDAVYSQEYVSALLVELEAANNREDGYRKKWVSELSNLQDAGKRIAELEGQLQSGFTPEALAQEERAESAEQRVAELEDKLATPVRLKKVDSSNVPFAGDGFNAAVDYCAKAVRSAGFTVEGDE